MAFLSRTARRQFRRQPTVVPASAVADAGDRTVRAGLIAFADAAAAQRRGRRPTSTTVRLRLPALGVMRSPHEEHARQNVEEHQPDPARHPMRARRAKVPVDDDDRDEDGDDVHDEREEEVLGDERYRDGRRRKDLRDEEQEDDEREEDADAHRHLLAGVRRKVEDADAEEGDEDARDDEVDGVEERLAAYLQRERDLRLEPALDRVERVVVLARAAEDVPRSAVDVVAQVDLLVALVPAERHLIAVERPRAELHLALLLVERKVLDVDGA